MNANTKQKGFTIIEVVLVLAIAALIFLMVFIALPALQRGQRDTTRKQDANTVITALNTWKGNHRGSLPNLDDQQTRDEFRENYIKQLGHYDATDDATFLRVKEAGRVSEGLNQDTIQISIGLQCNEDGTTTKDGSTRSAAVMIKLEASDAEVCIDA